MSLARSTEYNHVIRQVVNATGVQNASEISVRFAPQYQQIVFHQVSILRDGKPIDQLKNNRIKVIQDEDEAQNFIYHGMKRAYITLMDVQPGDRIEYSYSLEGFNPVFGRRYSGDFFFNGFTPFANYFISILTPAGHTLRIRSFNGARQPQLTHLGGTDLYSWSNPAIDFTETKAAVPSWYTHAPYVNVTEFADWSEVVDWGLGTFKDYRFPLPEQLVKRMAGWRMEAGGNKDRFVNLALRYVQDHIRYLGLEIGTNTHEPRAPSAVCATGFGDCKDKALLLVTILRKENIDASVALLNTTDRATMKEVQPAPNRFDHAIVALKRDSGYFFIDPTISLQRGELTDSYLPDYGFALVLKPGEKDLRPVNQSRRSEVTVTEFADVSGSGKGKFTVSTVYQGGPADNARSNFSGNGLKALGESFTGYYSKTYDGIEMVTSPEITDDSLKNEMIIREDYELPHPWEKQNQGRPAFAVYIKSIDERLPDVPADAGKTPLALRYPQTVRFTMKLKLPEKFDEKFEPVHIKNASYQFDFTQETSGDSLLYKYFLKTFRDNIPAADAAQFKKDYGNISDVLNFRFTRGSGGSGPAGPPEMPATWNWINLWIALGFGVCFSALFRYFNQQSPLMEGLSANRPLGGWTLVLGITMCLRLVVQAIFFYREHYFQPQVWDALYRTGGDRVLTIYVMEMMQALWSILGLGALIYWFFNRRNIFPLLFSYQLAVLILFQLATAVLSYLLETDKLNGTRNHQWTALMQTALYSAIWITYLHRSERARQTFVLPLTADR